MNSAIHAPLQTNAEQTARLASLQAAFAEVCNALAPLVQQTVCWNRVALHHMAYKQLRQRFPDLGSQMICNAIYSVSRTSRALYQHPASPANLQRLNGRPLPRLQFLPQSPVYFDRHTLSLKDGVASMFTLDGRMRFSLNLGPEAEQRFRTEKLREIVLTSKNQAFLLSFFFASTDDTHGVDAETPTQADLPEYVVILPDEAPPPSAQFNAPLHHSPQP